MKSPSVDTRGTSFPEEETTREEVRRSGDSHRHQVSTQVKIDQCHARTATLLSRSSFGYVWQSTNHGATCLADHAHIFAVVCLGRAYGATDHVFDPMKQVSRDHTTNRTSGKFVSHQMTYIARDEFYSATGALFRPNSTFTNQKEVCHETISKRVPLQWKHEWN